MKHTVFLSVVLVVASPVLAQVESLPAPVVNPNSFEVLSNSRYSTHSGFTSALSDTVLSNILWAMEEAPGLGSSFREFYIATPQNVYKYDAAGHALEVHLVGNHRCSSSSAFEIGVAVERDEEAGLSIQAGLLAGVAFWTAGNGWVTGCPMSFATTHANSNWNPDHPIMMVNVHGYRSGTGLNQTCNAVSSDSSLPMPSAVGTDTFEVLVADLEQDSVFDSQENLELQDISQLLWAGFGTTPHRPIGRQGLTVPSAVANYYLTRRIYLVRDTAVLRYHNRLPPGNNLATIDHRLELVTSGDWRDTLRSAVTRLPASAPVYIVVTVGDTTNGWHTIEAGFAAYQYLVQTRALGLGGHLVGNLTTAERSAVQAVLGLPVGDHPLVVFSTGQLYTGIVEQGPDAGHGISVRSAFGLPVRIEYTLSRPGPVELQIRDLAGRTVCGWTETATTSGLHTSEWAGTDLSGRPVAVGVYLLEVSAAGMTERTRVTLTR